MGNVQERGEKSVTFYAHHTYNSRTILIAAFSNKIKNMLHF